ncbi:unnamed protein product [Caenorhabditis brenneri]
MDSIENRKEAKLKQLASRYEILKSNNQNQTKKKIDLRATEKAFLDTSPTSINMKTPVNPNFTISAESTPSSPTLSFDEKADKQMIALATWTNTMIGMDSSEELDLGATAAEACRRIQKMLSKKAEASDVESLQAAAARLRYRKVFEKNDAEKIKKQCRKLLEDSGMEQSIRDLLSKKCIAIKNEIAVYSDLSLQTTLFRTFLCFHPAWLKAALEAIFNAKINAEPKFMIRALSQFFIERVFSNPAMLKNKKFAQGSGVPIITSAGKEALHRHFLEITMKMLFLIETAYAHRVIPNLTRIFTKSSHFKSMNEIFSELTRELLTGSSADFKKAFARIGFQSTYNQSFIESYNYQAKGFEDFSDGLILAKLIETVGEMPHGKLLLKLRDPAGDRLRKVNNVKTVLQEMTAIGINTEDVTAAAIVGGKKNAILAVLWSIVGVRVAKEKRVRFLRTKDASYEDLTIPKKKRRSGVHDDMSSEVLKTLKVIGGSLQMEVLDLDSLLDGLLLDKIWTTYVPNGTPIESYPGDDLWAKVVSLAESELAIPRGLDQNVALFVKMYLERVQMVQIYNEKAAKIQKMWKAYLEKKNKKKESPPTLSDMPVDVIGTIIDKLDYMHQLKLRKVSKSLRELVDKMKPSCEWIDVLFQDENVMITFIPMTGFDDLSVIYKSQKSTLGRGFWCWGDTITVIRDDFWKAALDDLASSLKNPKLHLEKLYVRTYTFQKVDTEKYCNEIRNVLESLNHQVSVKTISFQDLSPSCILFILPHLKPKVLKNISLSFDESDLNSLSTEIDQVALLDQWKNAEKLELGDCFDGFPKKHATHFKRFFIDESDLDGEKLIRIKDFLSKLENLEQCILSYWKFSHPHEVHELLGTPVSSCKAKEIFHHQIPDSDYYFEFTWPTESRANTH